MSSVSVVCVGDVAMNGRIANMDDGSYLGTLKTFSALEQAVPGAAPTPVRLAPTLRPDVPEKAPTPMQRARAAPTDALAPGAYRLVGGAPAILRRHAELASERAGQVQPGARLEVLETAALADGTVRARIREGWITAMKEGRATLEPVGGAAAAG